MTVEMSIQKELQGEELWRRQCARNLMDCYALAMETSMAPESEKDRNVFNELTRLMVEGMTAVRAKEDEESFYRMAAEQCRECATACGKSDKSRMFRIYAAIFGDMGH